MLQQWVSYVANMPANTILTSAHCYVLNPFGEPDRNPYTPLKTATDTDLQNFTMLHIDFYFVKFAIIL